MRRMGNWLNPSDLTRKQKLAVGFGLALLVVMIGALTWTFIAAVPDDLPGYALDNAVVFRIERALVLCAAFAILGVFTARLFAGELPSGITNKGVEWKGEDDIAAAIEKTRGSVEDLTEVSDAQTEALGQLREGLEALRPLPEKTAALQGDAEALSEGIDQLTKQVSVRADEIAELRGQLEALDQLPERTRALEEGASQLSARVDEVSARVGPEELTRAIDDLSQRVTKLEKR
jgi:hypothetical protein